jgi:putative heme-binding domain-containing protein
MRSSLLTWFFFLPGTVAAAEPWADSSAKLPADLALWLDASRQKAAYQAHGRSLAHTAALDVWYDASGHGTNFVQRVQERQPRYHEEGGVGFVRFHGREFIGRTGKLPPLDHFTLFVVSVPRSNRGNYSAWLAFSALGKNDYLTGLNIDQSFPASDRLTQLNAEGTGFSGAVNLMKDSFPFGQLRLIRLEGDSNIKLFLDGRFQGQRARHAGLVHMEALTLGARYYSNTPDPPYVQGFFDGDIAEVLLFRRAMKAEESKQVESYLRAKYAKLEQALLSGTGGTSGHLLRPIADPPLVQMLVPGFTVRELPLGLPNINNVRYRHDGKLVALGYNGNVYLLSDKDGDGLEDTAELFWENKTGIRGPIGILLTPKGYDKGQGLFVASKGKVSLIVDTDGDDKADKEIIVAEGWKEIAQAVDALGVAMDKHGNLYFGLGTADYANAYLKTPDGKALYDIKSDRGTIQRVSADFKKREIVCTGIRFPVGLAFNRHGDLFCTDQEGATWLPNGNPFDELLHIQPGRHYGFPPRHPKILPQVIDEPSVFDFGPQHQSTCGLFFNEPVNGGPIFGPPHWAGDALICGESRGKLFRTKLIKTPAGYVAQSHWLAALQMLTIDACVSPQGDLVVACHSGPPDWGTGPQGKGKLFKISYTDRQAPQPLFAYPAGPREARIVFDKPLDPAYLRTLAKQVKIEYGPYVRAGDRFETLQPPYAVVKHQLATRRYDLPVHSVQVTGDRQTLVLTTAPHTSGSHFAVTLPGFGVSEKGVAREIVQKNTIDLGYDLSGIHAKWIGEDGAKWSGWLPHMDLQVSEVLTAVSSEHAPLWKAIGKHGMLSLETRFDVWHMLRPAVQVGASIDYSLPPEEVHLRFGDVEVGNVEPRPMFATKSRSEKTKAPPEDDSRTFRIRPEKEKDWNVSWSVRASFDRFRTSYCTDEDKRPRALPLWRMRVPWAERKTVAAAVASQTPPQLRGGSWAHGKTIFYGDKALCSRCHQVRGQGGLIGPDLSNLIHRDYDSVLRDIRFPSAALNPDYLSTVVSLKDGRVLTGTLRSQGGKIFIGDADGKELAVTRDDVESMGHSAISIMPEGLDKKLTADELRDLLTFLLTEPMKPAPLERDGAPLPRKKSEVNKLLQSAERSSGPLKKIRIVLAAGPKDHGPGEHDYPLWQRRWLNLLLNAKNVQVSTAFGWPSPEQWKTADLIVFYSAHAGWAGDKAADLDAFLERGGGLAYIHWAVEGRKDARTLADRIGLASDASRLKFRHGPLELTFSGKHPITRGFDKLRFIDESYWNMVGDPGKVNVLGTSVEDGKPQPQMWTFEKGRGRVFVNILGHYTWTFDDPFFRMLMLRGMAWAAREPVDRWSELAVVGARITAD